MPKDSEVYQEAFAPIVEEFLYSSLQVSEVHLFNFKVRARAIFTSDS
jgi:hypothetical protein